MNMVHEVLAERVAATPDKVAVRGDDCVLTYAELDARANRAGERLRALGMGRESTVGVVARRSVELVVTLLGVLKSGAAYVPVDPRQPDRWRTTALRSMRRAASRGRDRHRAAGVRGGQTGSGRRTGPGNGGRPSRLCRVHLGVHWYPRGVAVPHEAVLRLALDPTCAPLDPHDRYLQFAPVAFDASTFEIWPPLLGGAELVVHPASEPSSAELAEFISAQKITTLWMTAGLFQLMVDAHVDHLAGVRRLVVGGDVVSPRHAAEILARVPGLRLVNGYGPTENTTFTCCHEVAPGEPGPLPIGRPITGTGVRVLDARLTPAVEGELYATGSGLARGYAGAPGLTAARFVCDPWSSPPGGRMYRTGDRVRVRPDGVLEFLGRADRQIKINGFRVEPGEVESALATQPGVRAVAVVAQPTTTGTQQLVAFVAPHRGQVLSVLGLRKQATAALPDYARPASYRVVDGLPLTVNGKVDRAELAGRVSRERPDLFTDYVPPRSLLEKQIAEMWSDLLGIDRIGVDDDFIVLGGHSLLSMRMTADIATEFAVALTPLDFYLRPTVAGLATLIEERTL